MPGIGFLNDNEGRSYPFITQQDAAFELERFGSGDSSSLALLPATFELPEATLVDFGCLMGPDAIFDTAADTVYLYEIRRRPDNFFSFEFRTTAEAAAGWSLSFSCPDDEARYTTLWAEAHKHPPGEAVDDSFSCQPDQPYEGFLVIGDLAPLRDLLDVGEAVRVLEGLVVEPALIQDLNGTFTRGINVANSVRLRTTIDAVCASSSSVALGDQVLLGDILANSLCLTGALTFSEGYNCSVTTDPTTNSLTISASVGAGAGEPCGEVPQFEGETPPPGSDLLSGGPACSQAVQTLNGLTGPIMQIIGGVGVTVFKTPGSDHSITVSIDLNELTQC